MAVWILALGFGSVRKAEAVAPAYTASSIVNAASGVSSILVPNGLATVYGTNLSAVTLSLSASDIKGGQLPYTLLGSGVSVLVNNVRAHIFYVSPTQVNFLVPSILNPGVANVELVRTGVTGGPVRVLVAAASPGLFLLKTSVAVATRADGSVLTGQSPARPGDFIVLYATGLGLTEPQVQYGEVARAAAWIERREEFRVILDGRTLTGGIYYAGVTPGFGGLYQVNLQLPDWTGPNPEVRIMCGDAASPNGIHIPVATDPAQAASPQ